MIKKIESKKMGTSNLEWLNSIFHFSFAEYYNPHNIRFGALRVINDDLIGAKEGFQLHPHKNMEIITYMIDGTLTHGDSMENENSINRGEIQYMSAGTGIYHSEYNLGDKTSRSLQIWIFPDKTGYKPNYGDYRFKWEDRHDKWLHMGSGQNGNAPVKINQDMNIYSLELEKGKEIDFKVPRNRQAYMVQIEGDSVVNNVELNARDAMEIVEEDILIKAKETSHIIIFEMAKER